MVHAAVFQENEKTMMKNPQAVCFRRIHLFQLA